MVWDRKRKGVARTKNKHLSNLTRSEAEEMLSVLEAQPDAAEREAEWQVIYSGGLLVDCKDEPDARQVAKTLSERGIRVTVRTLSAGEVIEELTGSLLRAWLNRG
jgi:muramidase (phage lysozyme)